MQQVPFRALFGIRPMSAPSPHPPPASSRPIRSLRSGADSRARLRRGLIRAPHDAAAEIPAGASLPHGQKNPSPARGRSSRRLRGRRLRVSPGNPLWHAVRTRGPQQLFRLSPWFTRAVTVWALCALLLSEVPVHAAALYWTGPVSGTWNPYTNWSTSPGAPTPNPVSLNSTDTFNFNISPLSQSQTVYLDGNQTANGLFFSNTGSTTLLGGNSASPGPNTLTLAGSGAAVTVIAGGGPVTLGTLGAGRVNLSLGGTGGQAVAFSNDASADLTIFNDVNDARNLGVVLSGSGAGISRIFGNISTTGRFTKTNSSRWTLSGTNTVGGSINALGGVLRLENSQALGAGSLWIGGGTTEFAGDTASTFNNNLSVTAANTITLDRLTPGAGVTHTLGTLSITNVTQTFTAGGLVASGTAGLILGTVTMTTNGPTFRVLNNYVQPAVRTQVTFGSLLGTTSSIPTFSGPGDLILSSSFGSSVNGLSKNGRGTLTLRANGTGNTLGGFAISGGSLILDYANMPALTNMVNTAPPVTLSGGTLAFQGRAGVAGSQSLGALTLGAGGGRILMNLNGATSGSLLFTTLNNSAQGGALLVGTFSSVGTVSSTATLTNNLLGGTARAIFFDGTNYRFASKVSGAADNIITGTTGTTLINATLTSTTNYELNGGTALTQGNQTLNSLRINSTGTSQSLSSNGSLTFTSGGLLFVGTQDYTISSSLRSGIAINPDLLIHHYGTGTLTVSGRILQAGSAAQALTKTGPGRLVLSGSNQFSGPIYVNEGTLSVTGPGSLEAGWNALGTTAARTVFLNGGTFQITGTAGYALTNKTFSLGGNGGFLDVGSRTFTLGTTANSLTGTGDLFLDGQTTSAGVLALAVGSNLSGDVYARKGTVRLTHATGAGTGALVVSEGAALDVQVAGVDNRIALRGTGISGSGALLNSSGLATASVTGPILLGTDVVIGGTLTLSGEVTDQGMGYGITKNGPSVLWVSGPTTLSGSIQVNGGTLSIRDYGRLTSGTVTVNGASAGIWLENTRQSIGVHRVLGGWMDA
jgi:fibronectin-binding autotransporter adhesin